MQASYKKCHVYVIMFYSIAYVRHNRRSHLIGERMTTTRVLITKRTIPEIWQLGSKYIACGLVLGMWIIKTWYLSKLGNMDCLTEIYCRTARDVLPSIRYVEQARGSLYEMYFISS